MGCAGCAEGAGESQRSGTVKSIEQLEADLVTALAAWVTGETGWENVRVARDAARASRAACDTPHEWDVAWAKLISARKKRVKNGDKNAQ